MSEFSSVFNVYDEASCWEMKAQFTVPGYYILSCCCYELRFHLVVLFSI